MEAARDGKEKGHSPLQGALRVEAGAVATWGAGTGLSQAGGDFQMPVVVTDHPVGFCGAQTRPSRPLRAFEEELGTCCAKEGAWAVAECCPNPLSSLSIWRKMERECFLGVKVDHECYLGSVAA